MIGQRLKAELGEDPGPGREKLGYVETDIDNIT